LHFEEKKKAFRQNAQESCNMDFRKRIRIVRMIFLPTVKNGNAIMPRGHFLLSSHKRKQKEPRGVPRDPLTALRQQ
jgi:hypothetical protein